MNQEYTKTFLTAKSFLGNFIFNPNHLSSRYLFFHAMVIQTNGKNNLPQPLLHANEVRTSISNSFGCEEYFANVF